MRRTVAIVVLTLIALGAAGWLGGCGCQEEIESSSTGTIDVGKDVSVKSSMTTLQTGIQAYIASSGAAPTTVDQATLGSLVQPWPENPWTKQPMKDSTAKGDYTYQNLGGTSYSLAGHLSDGSDYVRP